VVTDDLPLEKAATGYALMASRETGSVKERYSKSTSSGPRELFDIGLITARHISRARRKISDHPLGVSQQEATVLPKEYESSYQRILAPRRTVALLSYYRSHDVADAGACASGPRCFVGPVE
jgi:hypothetical protein